MEPDFDELAVNFLLKVLPSKAVDHLRDEDADNLAVLLEELYDDGFEAGLVAGVNHEKEVHAAPMA